MFTKWVDIILVLDISTAVHCSARFLSSKRPLRRVCNKKGGRYTILHTYVPTLYWKKKSYKPPSYYCVSHGKSGWNFIIQIFTTASLNWSCRGSTVLLKMGKSAITLGFWFGSLNHKKVPFFCNVENTLHFFRIWQALYFLNCPIFIQDHVIRRANLERMMWQSCRIFFSFSF